MLLEEANIWLNTPITEEQLQEITPLYYVLDLPNKEDFCNIINTLGIELFLGTKERFYHLLQGEAELREKEQYLRDMARLEELLAESSELEQRILDHQKKNAYLGGESC